LSCSPQAPLTPPSPGRTPLQANAYGRPRLEALERGVGFAPPSLDEISHSEYPPVCLRLRFRRNLRPDLASNDALGRSSATPYFDLDAGAYDRSARQRIHRTSIG